jgi:hypothetical protein
MLQAATPVTRAAKAKKGAYFMLELEISYQQHTYDD